MSQNSIILPTTGTVSGLQMTQYVNQALDTVNTLASGAAAPSSPEAGQLWHDTTNNIIKLRSLDNTSWIALLYVNETAYVAGSPALGQLSGTLNRLLNSAMVFDQVNEGSAYSVTTGSATYTADQWSGNLVSSTAIVTAQRVSDAPSGFSNSLKFTVGTSAGSVATNDFLTVFQPVEGYNVTDFNYGGSSAQACSLSFWVKSSIAGTFAASISNNANNRTIVLPFTIASPSVWQQVKIANIPGDVTGTWNSGTSIGLAVTVTMAAGTGFQTSTLNAWQNGNAVGSNTQTNSLLTTTGATFQLTGAMLNIGVFCAPYERLLMDMELTNLQRYYEKSFSIGTAVATNAGLNGSSCGVVGGTTSGARFGHTSFKGRKRVSPTVTLYNPSAANNNGVDSGGFAITSFLSENIGDGIFSVTGNASGSSIGRGVNYHWTANARL